MFGILSSSFCNQLVSSVLINPLRIYKVLFAFIAMFIASFAYAGSMTVTSTPGNVTINVTGVASGWYVKEGATQVGSGGSPGGVLNLIRSPGTYTYSLFECYGQSGCSNVSTKMVTVSAGLPAPSSIQVVASDIDGQFEVSWSSVANATGYILEQSKSSAAYVEVFRGAETVYGVLADAGQYKFRVKACNNNYSSCGTYIETSAATTVSGSSPSASRRVVFLHTDLLGSPSAESNENGRENE